MQKRIRFKENVMPQHCCKMDQSFSSVASGSATASAVKRCDKSAAQNMKWSQFNHQKLKMKLLREKCSINLVRFHKLELQPRKQPNPLLSILVGLLLVAIHNNYHSAASYNPGQPTSASQAAQSAAPSSTLASSPSPSSAPALAQQQAQQKPQEPTSVNLIPVDQPISSSSSSQNGSGGKLESSLGVSSAAGAAEERQAESELMSARDSSGGPSSQGAADSAPAQQGDDFSEPSAGQFYGDQLPAVEQQQQQEIIYSFAGQPQSQQQQKLTSNEQLASGNAATVERRFGLFKKGHQHGNNQPYGQPMMSAHYLQPNPFAMSDCERCLAGLQQQGGSGAASSFGELQSLDPSLIQPPPPPPSPPPQSQIIPVSQSSFSSNHFAPLKSKLFMKFPFFIKPTAFGGGEHSGFGAGGFSQHQAHHHPGFSWPLPNYQSSLLPTQRPASGALYLRPASSYNCIQTTPPILAAASTTSSQSSELLAPPPAPGTKGGGGHQFHVQQHHGQSTKHYSAASQQQQQTGYASS